MLLFAFVLLCGDQPDMPAGPLSCCGNCLYLSLHTESLISLKMLPGFVLFAFAVNAYTQACACITIILLLREQPVEPSSFTFCIELRPPH